MKILPKDFFEVKISKAIISYLFLGIILISMQMWTYLDNIKWRKAQETMSRHSVTENRFIEIYAALQFYYNIKNTLPDSLKELNSELHNRISDTPINDYWGRPIQYVKLSQHNFRLVSLGKDAKPGGQSDDSDMIFEQDMHSEFNPENFIFRH